MKNKKKKIIIALLTAFIIIEALFIFLRLFYITDVFYGSSNEADNGFNEGADFKNLYKVSVSEDQSFLEQEKKGSAKGKIIVSDPMRLGIFQQKKGIYSIYGTFYTHYNEKQNWYTILWIKSGPPPYYGLP